MKAARLLLSMMLLAVPVLSQPLREGMVAEKIGAVQVIKTNDPARPIFKPVDEDCGANLLLCGEFVQGTLTNRDCSLDDGTFLDVHFFPGRTGYIAAAAALSDDFAPDISLYTPSITLWDFELGNPGDAVAVGAYLHTTGPWAVTVGSRPTVPTRTGDYLLLLSCNSTGRCKADPTTLCLGEGRYRVQVGYENQFSETFGFGGALPIARSTESGYFYFGSDPSNIELLIKILDFGNGNIKVFWGQLTNLRYKIVVTDMITDDSKTYLSPASNCGGTDDDAFPKAAVASWAGCRADSHTGCILKNRFQVTGTWRNQYDGSSGELGATRVSDLTSAFYFGSPGNVELLVKMVDLGSRIALFYGAMSNLEYTLTVRDTATGEEKIYHNPAGKYCGGLDDFPR